MRRRHLLGGGCAACALLATWRADASPSWAAPPRFERPAPASDEGGLWDSMDRQEVALRRSPFRIRDAALQNYLQDLACSLAGSHCPDLRVHPIRNPYFNASMAPNGMLQVWSGLLLRMENEAQLATVLAHELGHYMQRHALERLRDAKSRTAFTMFMGGFGIVGLLPQLAALAGAFAFSREQEIEADMIGLELMQRVGYDPREASKVWGNLMAELAVTPGSTPERSSPMFATHPPSEQRFAALVKLAADRSGALREAEYRARTQPLRFEWLDDEIHRGRPEESLALLDRMVAAEPGDAALLFFRGETRRLRAREGDPALALADLQAAAAAGGEPPETYRALGHLHSQRGEPEAAREAFERYLVLSPKAADAPLIRQQLQETRP
jgi:predicted Zn-dependent protease